MGPKLTTVAAIAAVAALSAACSGGKSTPTSSSSSTSSSSQPAMPSSSPAQGGAPDQATCLNISFTKDNLMVAQSAEAARRFADTLESYHPPDPVKAAVEHFVTTVGAQPNDPDVDSNRDQITGWIRQICPGVNP